VKNTEKQIKLDKNKPSELFLANLLGTDILIESGSADYETKLRDWKTEIDEIKEKIDEIENVFNLEL
jgi:hypothetical protein